MEPVSWIRNIYVHLHRMLSYERIIPSAAPELLSSWMRSLSTDVFSVGIILLELVLRNSAYSITNLNKYETPYGYDQYLFIQDIIHGFRPRLPRDCPQCTSEYVKVMCRLC